MIKKKSKVVLIVDAFSTGKYFAALLNRRGYLALHIQSSSSIPSFFLQGFSKEHYIDHIIFENNFDSLMAKLQKYSISAVIAGCETAIYLADKLAEMLQLPGNSSRTSHLRRDKFDMINALKLGGLATASQIKSNNIEEIQYWHRTSMNNEWPLVVKPVNSAGTDSVRFCYNHNELFDAFENILGKKNKLGFLNEAVLIQSFLDGQEYIVNTVSCFSKHTLTDIRLCHKKKVPGAGYISGCEELLPAEEPICQTLKNYAFQALDLLNISNGPGHFEIMVTERGPMIIEMGARLQGGINPAANAICFGKQQIDKTIDAYLDPNQFLTYYTEDYRLEKFGAWVFLSSLKSGILTSIPFMNEVKKLPSFFSLQMNVHPGKQLERTIDYYSSPGSVHLVNENKHQLMIDINKIRELEIDGFLLA